MGRSFGKTACFAAALALAAMLFVGASARAAEGTLTVWVGSWWEPQVGVTKELWAKDHPEIPLDIQPLPINGYLDKFTATALGGEVPDIIDLDSTWTSTVAAHGLLQPLDDLIPRLPVADISPAAFAASKFKGTLYAVPMRSGTCVYYYNKTVFDRAGVPYPTAGWDYDDFLEISKKLTIPGEQYGVGVAADISDPSNVINIFAPILWAKGGDFLSADGTKPLINSPESIEAITYWADLYLKHKVAPEGTPNFTTTRDIHPLFIANKVGMFATASNAFDDFIKLPDLKWGTVFFPEKITTGGGWTMAIPEGAVNTGAAKTFLLWLSQPEIQAKVMNRSPSNRKAHQLPPWNDPAKKIFVDAEADGRPVPSVAGWFQMQEGLIVELQKILVGQATVQEAADNAAAIMERIIAENQ